MSPDKTIKAYIARHREWSEGLGMLRTVLKKHELEETVKWGAPTYTINGKIVITFAGFKNHFALWFYQGVFLKDKAKKLVSAQGGSTKGLRQWRFQSADEIDSILLSRYILEAIENHKAGKRIKPTSKKLAVPVELRSALKKDLSLKKAFESLTPGKQREYADHIGSAKQEKTRQSRLEKAIPKIKKGVGLNDQYKT